MILGQHQPGIGFVVSQNDVEAWLQPLDQVRFQQKRLSFGMGRDDFHRRGFRDHPAQPLRQAPDLRIRRDAPIQAARLAHVERIAFGIQHAVNARSPRHRCQGGVDRNHTRVGRHRHAAETGPNCCARNAIAASTPPRPCGMPSIRSAISIAASAPSSIGSFRSPR